MLSLYCINFVRDVTHICQGQAAAQSSWEQETRKWGRMRIHFELILNSVTPGQPQRRGRGRTSPTQRCGARDLRPGAVLCPAVRRGALQTARRAAPASTSGRPGAAAPGCGPLAPAPAAATPGPGVQTRLRAGKQDRGPRGLSGHRPGGKGRGPRSALHMGAPAPRPARTYISTWAPKGSGVQVFRDGYGCPGTGPRQNRGDLHSSGSDRRRRGNAAREPGLWEDPQRIWMSFRCFPTLPTRTPSSPLPCGFHTPPSSLTEFWLWTQTWSGVFGARPQAAGDLAFAKAAASGHGISVPGEEIPPQTIRGEVKLSKVAPRLGFWHAMTLTLPHGHLGYRTI